MTVNSADFETLEELAGLLEALGLRLHAKNRIAGGESVYLWHLAETIRKTGHLATRFGKEPELHELFGDGYQTGIIPDNEQRNRFLSLLSEGYGAGNK